MLNNSKLHSEVQMQFKKLWELIRKEITSSYNNILYYIAQYIIWQTIFYLISDHPCQSHVWNPPMTDYLKALYLQVNKF